MIAWPLQNKLQINLKQNAMIFTKNSFENVASKMVTILLRPQYVKQTTSSMLMRRRREEPSPGKHDVDNISLAYENLPSWESQNTCRFSSTVRNKMLIFKNKLKTGSERTQQMAWHLIGDQAWSGVSWHPATVSLTLIIMTQVFWPDLRSSLRFVSWVSAKPDQTTFVLVTSQDAV